MGLGARFYDQIGYPGAEHDDGEQGRYTADALAEGVNIVHPANNGIVLFLRGGKSAFAEKELVGFMLRQLPAVNHQTNESGDDDAPEYSHYRESVHNIGLQKKFAWLEHSHVAHNVREFVWICWPDEMKHTRTSVAL